MLCRTFPPMLGGLERYTSELVRRAGIPLQILAPQFGDAARYDREFPRRVTRFPYAQRWHATKIPLAPMALWAAALAALHTPALIIADQVQSGGIGLPLARFLGIPHVVFAYGRELSPERSGTAKRRVFGGSDRVVAISTYTQRTVVATYGIPEDRVPIIRPGIDVQTLAPHRDRGNVRAELGMAQSDLGLLAVGRLEKACRYKGFDRSIFALAGIAAEFPTATLTIVGDGDDKRYLEQLAVSLGIGEKVRFLGRLSDEDLRKRYQAADVFILPSGSPKGSFDSEGYGIVFAEAAACGLPSVGLNAGGVTDVVANGDTGILVDPERGDLVAAVRSLLADQDRRHRMAEAARRRAVSHLSWERSATMLQQLVAELGGVRNTATP